MSEVEKTSLMWELPLFPPGHWPRRSRREQLEDLLYLRLHPRLRTLRKRAIVACQKLGPCGPVASAVHDDLVAQGIPSGIAGMDEDKDGAFEAVARLGRVWDLVKAVRTRLGETDLDRWTLDHDDTAVPT